MGRRTSRLIAIIFIFSFLACSSNPPFVADAVVTLADGSAFDVANFAFYDNNYFMYGWFIGLSAGSEECPLYVKRGPIWKLIDLDQLMSIEFPESGNGEWRTMTVLSLDGSSSPRSITGQYPTDVGSTWFRQGKFFLVGVSKAGDLIREVDHELSTIWKIERTDDYAGRRTFRVYIQNPLDGQTPWSDVINPHFRLKWDKRDHPRSCDVYKLEDEMTVYYGTWSTVLRLRDIDSVSPIPEHVSFFNVKTKKAELLQGGLPPRIYGKLENGDILFSPLRKDGIPIIKSIVIK